MGFSKKAQQKIDELETRIKVLEDEKQDKHIRYIYSLFDVEATRRELSFCHKLLREEEEKGGDLT